MISDDMISRLQSRAAALGALRGVLTARGYVEVDTPVRLPAPALELHIDAEPAGEWFLRTSPELFHKRLLAAGAERIFELGPCFRRGERGRLHHPEFTMLEWYRAGAIYTDMIAETEALVAAAAAAIDVLTPAASHIDWSGPWERLTVRDAFRTSAGWDPIAHYDAHRFDVDLVEKIEPCLPRDRPVVLLDYPVGAAALARCRGNRPPVAERWELYAAGIELANAYGELTDAAEQRRRFAACAVERERLGKSVYPVDDAFLGALDAGLPDCAGVALGVDRLLMLLTGAASVADVRLFAE